MYLMFLSIPYSFLFKGDISEPFRAVAAIIGRNETLKGLKNLCYCTRTKTTVEMQQNHSLQNKINNKSLQIFTDTCQLGCLTTSPWDGKRPCFIGLASHLCHRVSSSSAVQGAGAKHDSCLHLWLCHCKPGELLSSKVVAFSCIAVGSLLMQKSEALTELSCHFFCERELRKKP